jgi:hypothetical protein
MRLVPAPRGLDHLLQRREIRPPAQFRGLDVVFSDRLIEAGGVSYVASDQPASGGGRAVPVAQVVVHPDVVAALNKMSDHMTAKITSATGHQDSH